MRAYLAQRLTQTRSALAATAGDTPTLFPFFPGAGNALRYQQVYGASEFASFAPGGELITQLAFRVDPDSGFAFAATVPSIQLSLSTTAKSPDGLSRTFANNVGADETVVFPAAPLTLASTASGPAGGPKAFDILVPLVTPFFYDPSRGNLLLDIRNFQGGDSVPSQSELDGTMNPAGALSSAFNFGNANAATVSQSGGVDDFSTEGVVTQFTTVPEPGAAALAGFGLVALALGWRARAQRILP